MMLPKVTRRRVLQMTLLTPALRAAPDGRWRAEEVRRWPAAEANQAVAVDAEHFYAIGNHSIAKYDKTTGARLAGWECERGNPLVHLNSGVVREGVLYCAHSNYPEMPVVSSIEMWDTATMRHKGTRSFGVYSGSATWVDFYQGHWYVTFAHYRGRAAEPGRDPRWTSLEQFDTEGRRLQGWIYPPDVISRLGDYSISGGLFLPDGTLLCTGHDNPEIYVLGFPEGASTLVLRDTFAVPNEGQGIARDPVEPGILYSIDRRKREVIVMRVSQN